jgi:transmembrane sensor
MGQTVKPSKHVNHDLLQQAAEWFALLQSGSATDQERKDWQHWLSSNDLHQQAWQKVEHISHRFNDLPIETSRVVLDKSAISRRSILKSLAFVFITTGAGWQWLRHQNWDAQYRTARGEIHQFTAEDGSKIWLNTDGSVDVLYTLTTRKITLRRGEIYIETAADITTHLIRKKRPLIVDTQFGSIQALGTRFSVRDKENQIVVSVMEGEVKAQLSNQTQARRIKAGQQITFNQNSFSSISQQEQEPSSPSPWIKGVILADNMRLADFIDELNRYHKGRISYDPTIANLRLVGAYPVEDVDRILTALENSLPIIVSRTTPLRINIQAK